VDVARDEKDREKERFAREVRTRRRALGLSLAALAERCGLSVNYVTSIEAGKRDVSLSTAVSLATALGVPVERLVQGDGPTHEEPEVVRLVRGLPLTAQRALARFLTATSKRRR
jgi:transcriptional regulator with XRE-family HTH domain